MKKNRREQPRLIFVGSNADDPDASQHPTHDKRAWPSFSIHRNDQDCCYSRHYRKSYSGHGSRALKTLGSHWRRRPRGGRHALQHMRAPASCLHMQPLSTTHWSLCCKRCAWTICLERPPHGWKTALLDSQVRHRATSIPCNLNFLYQCLFTTRACNRSNHERDASHNHVCKVCSREQSRGLAGAAGSTKY